MIIIQMGQSLSPPRLAHDDIQPYVRACGEYPPIAGFHWPEHLLYGHVFSHILLGGGHFIVNGERLEMRPGMLFFFRAGEHLAAEADERAPYLHQVVHFDFYYASRYSEAPVEIPSQFPQQPHLIVPTPHFSEPLLLPRQINMAHRPEVKTLFSTMVREKQEERPGYRLAMRAYLLELILLVHREASAVSTLPPLPDFVLLAREHIEQHFAEKLTLAELAHICCVSASHLSRVFKQQYGYAPIEYLLRLRLAKAKQLLLTTTLSVSQIAEYLGFSDPHYFSFFFSKQEGRSPRDYREKTSLLSLK